MLFSETPSALTSVPYLHLAQSPPRLPFCPSSALENAALRSDPQWALYRSGLRVQWNRGKELIGMRCCRWGGGCCLLCPRSCTRWRGVRRVGAVGVASRLPTPGPGCGPSQAARSPPPCAFVLHFGVWVFCFGAKRTVKSCVKEAKREIKWRLKMLFLVKYWCVKLSSLNNKGRKIWILKSQLEAKKLQRSCKWSIWAKCIAVIVRQTLAGWWWCATGSFLQVFLKIRFKEQWNCVLNKEHSVFTISMPDYLLCVLFFVVFLF